MSRRFELTFPDELWQRMEKARKHEPAASYIKRAVEAALSDDTHGREPRGASSGHSHAEHYASATGAASARGASRPAASPRASEGTPIPKIAKRKW